MAYSAPSLQQPIVLQGGYQAPSLSIGVVLGQGGVALVTATVAVALPPGPIAVGALSGAAHVGAQGVISARLDAAVPGISVTAVGEVGITYSGAMSASLAAPNVSRFEVSCNGQSGVAAAAVLGMAVPQMVARAIAGGAYDIALPEADGVGAALAAQAAQPVASAIDLIQQSTQVTRTAEWMAAYQGRPVCAAAVVRAASALSVRRGSTAHHQHGRSVGAGTGSRQQSTRPLHRPIRQPHQHALARCSGAHLRQTSTRRPGKLLHLSAHQARQINKGLPARQHDRGQVVAKPLRLRWQDGMAPLPGRWWPWYEPPGLVIVIPGPPYTPRPLKCRLVLGPGYAVQPPCDYNPQEPETPGHIIPVRRTYMILNEVTLRRVDSNLEVVPLSLEISIDRDSWTWSWSADVAFSEWSYLSSLNGEPLELEAMVNGYRWRLKMEGAPSRTRSFGRTGVKISGRGIASELDEPEAPSQEFFSASGGTAQQLMAQALSYNGVSLGWSLDWRVTDWLVPGNVWSVSGAPIAGVLDVAEAVQAVIQADRVQRVLRVLPRYPAAPWDWDALTPDIEIPPDIIISETLEPQHRADYNAVIVSGQAQGRMGRVVRAGTAGDRMAPMVTHPLLTATDALRQRGIAELGNTGRMASVTLAMPISQDTTLIEVGQLASFVEAADPFRGLVVGTGVSAQRDGDRGLQVFQRPVFERHYS